MRCDGGQVVLWDDGDGDGVGVGVEKPSKSILNGLADLVMATRW